MNPMQNKTAAAARPGVRVDPQVRPRLLDLFCCAGGAAMGYHRAGFEIVGVDIYGLYPLTNTQYSAKIVETRLAGDKECQDWVKLPGVRTLEPARTRIKLFGLPARTAEKNDGCFSGTESHKANGAIRAGRDIGQRTRVAGNVARNTHAGKVASQLQRAVISKFGWTRRTRSMMRWQEKMVTFLSTDW